VGKNEWFILIITYQGYNNTVVFIKSSISSTIEIANKYERVVFLRTHHRTAVYLF